MKEEVRLGTRDGVRLHWKAQGDLCACLHALIDEGYVRIATFRAPPVQERVVRHAGYDRVSLPLAGADVLYQAPVIDHPSQRRGFRVYVLRCPVCGEKTHHDQ